MSSRALLGVAGLALLVASGLSAWGLPGAVETFGGIGADAEVVAFDDIAARHFRALAVDRQDGAPSDRAVLVRVNLVGPAPDVARAEAWLAEHAGVVVAHDADGVPIVFVEGDLATQRGREALGATIPRGIAIETRQPALVDCVYAHEILHFLGLKHVEDDTDDLMHPRCESDKPHSAHLSPAAHDALGRIDSIHALTLTGRLTWAERI